MAEINVAPGIDSLSVKLTFDMEAYCKASKNLRESRLALKAAKATADQNLIQTAEKTVKDTSIWHAAERKKIAPALNTVNGAIKWNEIKSLLAKQCRCDAEHPEETTLAAQLTPSDFLPIQMAHNLFSLNTSFIELFKNSVDEMVEQYIMHDVMNTIVDVNIALIIKEDGFIDVTFSDNAGGISQDAEIAFSKRIGEKEYKDQRGKSKKRQDPDDQNITYDPDAPNNYYFGGAGLGVPILCSLFLDGEVLDEHGHYIRSHKVPVGQTSISMALNPEKNGTITTLSAPLKPFAPAVSSQDKSLFVSSGLSALQMRRAARLAATKEVAPTKEVSSKPGFFQKPVFIASESDVKIISKRSSRKASTQASRRASKQASRRASVDDLLATAGLFSTCAAMSRSASRASSRHDETINALAVL